MITYTLLYHCTGSGCRNNWAVERTASVITQYHPAECPVCGAVTIPYKLNRKPVEVMDYPNTRAAIAALDAFRTRPGWNRQEDSDLDYDVREAFWVDTWKTKVRTKDQCLGLRVEQIRAIIESNS